MKEKIYAHLQKEKQAQNTTQQVTKSGLFLYPSY